MDKFDKWALIETELIAAFEILPKNVKQSANGYCKADFQEYIQHNELLLAMEELDGVIIDNAILPKHFWNHMIKAAELMEHDHADRYKSIRGAAK